MMPERHPDIDTPSSLPLSARLRLEAAQWEDGEDIPALLIEAAEVIEGIGDAVAQAAVIGAKYALR